ncbi:MAG: PhzF family phenazine biosynthesis protein [Pyrinomonadaceae bacterium]|nr:PhzF family phenazine biosynthesis protein [Pyrinomonadaceae bacterium]
MQNHPFYQLDVFTETVFSGNPLAVFTDSFQLSDAEMQAIALEMNLSETVFVLPSEKALRRLRIFTPLKELPLAGHPVVGTWNLLARLGIVENAPANGKIVIDQELGVGVLPVEIEFADGAPRKVTMTQGKFQVIATVDDEVQRKLIAESLGLTTADFVENLPIQVCSTGISILIVPLKSLDVLRRCRVGGAKLSKVNPNFVNGIYPFSLETFEKENFAHARLFAPEHGIIEDPATGSAAGSLSGYLVNHQLVDESKVINGEFHFTIEQGDFMKRKSRIFASVKGEAGSIETVKIGGNSVIVAKGELFYNAV